jgi:hypothetical protein
MAAKQAKGTVIMISDELASALKQNGLQWHPAERDFFMMPDRNMDGQVFVVSPLPALVQSFSGEWTITFHGAIEWALDSVVMSEAVWLPTETQLRELLARVVGDDAPLRLDRLQSGYRLQIGIGADVLEFEATTADDAYGRALLHVLQATPPSATI